VQVEVTLIYGKHSNNNRSYVQWEVTGFSSMTSETDWKSIFNYGHTDFQEDGISWKGFSPSTLKEVGTELRELLVRLDDSANEIISAGKEFQVLYKALKPYIPGLSSERFFAAEKWGSPAWKSKRFLIKRAPLFIEIEYIGKPDFRDQPISFSGRNVSELIQNMKDKYWSDKKYWMEQYGKDYTPWSWLKL